jgi:hypothetical protein
VAQENAILTSASLKQFYKYVNKRFRPRPKPIALLTPGDSSAITDAAIVSDRLNNYFASVYTIDNGNIPQHVSQQHKISDHADAVFTPNIIQKKLLTLKPSSSSGPDGIHPSILKYCSAELSYPLSIIFNKSYQTGCLPTQWLQAEVTPIYKNSGSRLSVENYRPISLTSIPCKMFESILKDSMLSHVESNNLLHPNQHGFRPNRSTVTNLLETIHDWYLSLDNGLNVDAIFIDFKKAFDSISHEKLLYKLSSYGFSQLTLTWVKAFLTDRKQRVKIGSALSPWLPCSSGVPQGSVLGPLLFILFINDLADVCTHGTLKLYADDATLYAKVNSLADAQLLQNTLCNVLKWSKLWQLPLNIKKCNFMRLKSSSPITFTYCLEGVMLDRVQSAKLLGITICPDLSFSKHCDTIVALAYKRTYLLLTAFTSSNRATMCSLFNTFIRPVLEYATPVWSPYLLKDIDNIEGVQRFFTRSLPCLSGVSYPNRLILLRLPSLELRRIHTDCIMLYKLTHNLVSMPFHNMFSLRSHIHTTSMSLRGNSLMLNLPRCKTVACQNCYFVRTVNYWNSMQDAVITASTLSMFKTFLYNVDLDVFLRGRAITRP